ncbi:MAG: matrixin family metalloprotease [Thermoanaerobaculia bacterium]
MKKIMTSRIVLAATALALIAGSISAYQLLNPRRTWQNTPTYIVDNGSLAGVTNPTNKVINAITSNDAWNGAGSGTVINATSGSMANFTLGDNIPMLNFEDPTGQCSGNCLAATFTGFFTRRGRRAIINDADIVTNTAHPWTSVGDGCSNEFFIEGVQVHEAGHGLGLGHSSVSGATMFPSVGACDNGPATTAQDDEDGICDLYGGCGGGGCTLGQKGDACTANNQCCSGKCRGPSGRMTCK